MPTPLRDVPQEAIELIKCFEGIPDGDPTTVGLDAYICPASVWTIGWGHAVMDGGAQLKGPANKARARQLYPGGISRSQAEALLRGDLVPRAASVSSVLKVTLDDGQFGALMALVFNIGAGNFAASTLLRKLNAGDLAGAAEQFMAWDKARVNGVLQPLAGLTRRRRAERAMFLGEDWRAAAAQRATRGRAAVRQVLQVLPVPEAPADQALATPVKKVAAKKGAAGKGAAKKAPAKKAAAKKAVPMPRARTTTPKAPPPAPTAKRPALRKAR